MAKSNVHFFTTAKSYGSETETTMTVNSRVEYKKLVNEDEDEITLDCASTNTNNDEEAIIPIGEDDPPPEPETPDGNGDRRSTELTSSFKEFYKVISKLPEDPKFGLFYAAMSGLMFGVTTALSKHLSKNISMDTIQLAFLRFVACIALSLASAFLFRQNPFQFTIENSENLPKDNRIWELLNRVTICGNVAKARWIFIVRGVLVAPAIYLTFNSVSYIPLSEATVILFTSTLFTAGLAWWLLKEPFPRHRILGMIFSCVGVVLITGKENWDAFKSNDTALVNEKDQIRGSLEALGGAVLISFVYVLTRSTKGVNEYVQVFHYTFVAAAAILLFSSLNQSVKDWHLPKFSADNVCLATMMICGYFGQLFMSKAMRVYHSGPVSLVRSVLDLMVSFVFQVGMFKTVPDLYGLLGAGFIMVGLILFAF